MSAVAVVLALIALALIGWWAGWSAVGRAFSDFHPAWIALVVSAQGVAFAAYAVAYQAVTRVRGGRGIPLAVVAPTVVAGFGAFAVGGGFVVDQRVLRVADGTAAGATVRVLGLGALEYALLAPAACIAAIALLAAGDSRVQGAVLWPWAIAVPVGFAAGLWAATPQRLGRLGARRFQAIVDGVGALRDLAAHPLRYAGAWIGMALYWVADIASLYGALRLFGVQLGAAATILGYATGYALTRRALPLGGAGITEALLSVALMWVGLPLARALPAVLVYRIANFLLPLWPAMRAYRTTIEPMMEEAEARLATECPRADRAA
jgi:uncharacterized membrane protein YbhN (UPF0104 family)